MKQDDALYIKIPEKLKAHVNQWVAKKPYKGGVSALVRDLLTKRTKFEDKP